MPAMRRGRRAVASQAGRIRAETLLAQAIDEAHREGFLAALAQVEREIYCCESIEEVYRWLNGALRVSAEEETG